MSQLSHNTRTVPRLGGMFARTGALLQMAPLGAIFLTLFAVPMLLLFWVSLWRYDVNGFGPTAPTVENYARFLTDPFYLAALGRTVLLGLVTTTVTVIVAYPVALIMARSGPRIRALLILLVLLPLLMSVVVRVFGWMVILGDTGVLNKFLVGLGLVEQPLRLMESMTSVVIGLAQVEMAFAVMPIYSALLGIDRHLDEAASTLGARPMRRFLRIVLPLSLPGVAGAAAVIFSLSVAAFVQPQLLGGSSFFVMTTLIYQQVTATLNWPFAAALGLILLAVALGMLALINAGFRLVMPRGLR
ncbi:ABC transporter permease [Bosea sp. (in: a-proteobacteria)]|uniref:ABC transporter permease n=1 Tax=Bosea sp. (in: a-proteobacteria) TaxID=1871050 RepID=UPI00261683DC|nr:ABC transporter permease [Bosea sp. (in: a-proteobacteria)]MCO5089537.1 ABC transporter permease [Bosea sp. (in: a-proteobacteria)]